MANEVRALSTLAFDELRRFPAAVRDMQLGIAERAFRGVGPAALPVKIVYEAVTRRVYDVLDGGAAIVGAAADNQLAKRGVGSGVTLSNTRRGGTLIAALNGLIGDQLEHSASDLHQPAAVRLDGDVVALEADSLRRAYPDASGQIVVFLHGLMETEFSWSWGAGDPADTYGGRLQAEVGCTPLYVRYNSGLHVSENGHAVAELLDELVDAWPVEVRSIALVGHSMGGLVARSACHAGTLEGHAWTRAVRHVISLGTPHLGAPLEQGAHVAAAALWQLPETRMIAAFLRRRSAGIRDLRHGSLVDEDWRGRDPDALRASACAEVPLLDCATHCFVSATVTRDPRHPIGRLLGDMLVLVPSATGRGRTRRIPFESEYGRHLSPVHHFALLNDPRVYEWLRDWLCADRREAIRLHAD